MYPTFLLPNGKNLGLPIFYVVVNLDVFQRNLSVRSSPRTVCKLHDFSVGQILREIDFGQKILKQWLF